MLGFLPSLIHYYINNNYYTYYYISNKVVGHDKRIIVSNTHLLVVERPYFRKVILNYYFNAKNKFRFKYT